MPDIPSAELLVRYQAGDPRAASELFHRYEHRLHRLARSCLAPRLARRVAPEDVVQSACRSFFRRARAGAFTLAERGDLWRLLARITRHKVCRSARRHGADCRAVGREQQVEAEYADPSQDPAEAAVLADELAAALESLPPMQQRVVELSLEGVPPHQIAARLGCSNRTVRRALDELRSDLERRLLTPDDCAILPYGDVVLRRLLGGGGMGKVYRAEYRPTGRPVAVKVLRKCLLSRPGLVACFRGEARVLSRLNHPGIVRVHGAGRLPDGGHFLAMDLIEGPDLGQVLGAGPVPPELAARWVVAVAEAVEYAHQQGVIHCDLKPGNVLLQWGLAADDPRSAVPKVVDFGLARVLGPRTAPSVGGTAGYMAPEQCDGHGEGVSARTDVYGLGGLLYALLTGHPPTAGAGGERARPSVLRPEVPAALEAVCMRCLEQEPGRRFATAGEMAAALEGERARWLGAWLPQGMK